MQIFGITGWSGSGKTELLTKLIPELVGRGITVSTVKHAHHDFDIDTPGKDSYEHREAGATEVMISSEKRWALMREHRGAREFSMAELIARMEPVDLVLVEGFKTGDHDKLEVHRPSVGKPLLCRDRAGFVAVASDTDLPGLDIPVFDLDDVATIADFIVEHCGLAGRRKETA